MIRYLVKNILTEAFYTRFGQEMLRIGLYATRFRVFGARTTKLMEFDLARLKARAKHPPRGEKIAAPSDRLHLGCGGRCVSGWLNVDVSDSDYDVDLAAGDLPWRDAEFSAIISQQVIEHLELESELLPLLYELHRVSKPHAELWLSCPDLQRVCNSYNEDRGQGLIDDWLTRYGKIIYRLPSCSDATQGPHGEPEMADMPCQHMINYWFHQSGEHRNLFDFELLNWALLKSGFENCVRVNEEQFLRRFPEFSHRCDDRYCLYVKAIAGERKNSKRT